MAYQQQGYPQQAYPMQPPYNQQYNQNSYQGQGVPPPGFIPPPVPRYMPTSNSAENGGQDYSRSTDDGFFKYSLHFNERSIRMAFIRKVFFLVTIMLAVVAVMTAVPFLSPSLKSSLSRSVGWFYVAYAVFLVTYLVLVCCEGVRRSFPANIILTALFTVATGFMTSCLSVQLSTESVLLALVITTVCCSAIIIFAMQTKYDLTSCMGVMFILTIALFVFGLIITIGTLVFNVSWLNTVYAGAAALLFMAYLAIDVQMLMGGRKYEISPEDHIFAAVQLFLDIVYIFWFILSIFGSRD